MDLYDVVKSRHSVRKYLDKEIPSNIVKTLHEEISKCNEEGNLHIQLVLNDYNAFSGMKASYGKIKGVSNYIVLVGKRSKFLDEKLGYYGEKLVLKAQELGLNSCWIGLSMIYKNTKDAYEIRDGERKRLIIAIGYGENCGHDRNSKKFSDVVLTKLPEYPNWFIKGIEFSLLAPTAMNQQKFSFELDNNQVALRHGNGFYTKVDKGIVKYHFELGAGKNNFVWKK